MHLEAPTSLEDRWLEIFRQLGEPQALLACTFTFHADFFAGLLARFAEAACEGGASDGRPFSHVPVDVVCDRTKYSGHRVGFNVTLWPSATRLFHPKLFIVLFRDEVVWSDGSLNLTPAGWRRNREIAMLHRPGRRALPCALRELLEAEAVRGVAAAKCILEATCNQPHDDLPGTFFTSLNAPIGPCFLSHAPKYAEEVHLAAPFFEKGESIDEALDGRWLRLLAQRYPNARFHVYLPQLEAEPLRVQGRRALIEELERKIAEPVALHPVTDAPGPLHGKIACVVHTPNRIQRAHILVGSPNMTRAALLAPASQGNIESAWILDERWQDAKRLFRGLGAKPRAIDEVEFVEPLMSRAEIWMPLRRASYDPLRRVLRVEWRDAADARQTVLRYAGRPLELERDGIRRDFDLVDGIGYLVTRKRGGGVGAGCYPIEVPVELLPACHEGVPNRTPEEWLRMLGAVSSDAQETGSRNIANGDGQALEPCTGFEWSERVRDLAGRIRYFEAALADNALNSAERDWLLTLFQHIYDSHDPTAIANVHERVWRVWVRLELWHAACDRASKSGGKDERRIWQVRARRLRKQLGTAALLAPARTQIRSAVNVLKELV